MTPPARVLDFAPLRPRSRAGDRLRAIGASPRMVFSVLVLGLMVVVFGGVLIFVLAAGHAGESVLFVLLPVMFVVVGCWALWSVWGAADQAGSLVRFAQVNDLAVVSSTLAPEYAGGLFAGRLAAVDRSVRTRGRDFVEVGNQLPVTDGGHLAAPSVSGVGPGLFLRARLAGGAANDPDLGVRVPAGLAERLERLAGEAYEVEMTAGELTVFGSRTLGFEDPGEMREAFALIDALAARNAVRAASMTDASVTSTPRGRGPVKVVLGVAAMFVMVPIGFALVMSAAGGLLGHGQRAGAIVLPLAVVAGVVTWLIVRRILKPATPPGDGTR